MAKKHLSKSLRSGLAYGLGLILGNFVSGWIFDNVSMGWLAEDSSNRLGLGILLAFLIAGLAGWIGGFIGGFTLDTLRHSRGRWGYAWRSAVVFAVGYGLMLFPLGLIVSLLGFYAGEEILTARFGLVMAIFGAVFGLSVSGILGLMTVGLRRALRVLSVGLLGFGIGGVGLGWGLHAFLYSVINGEVREGQVLWLLLGLLAFGAIGGGFLGYIYSYLSAEDVDAPALPRGALSAAWRVVLAVAVVLIFVFLFRPTLSQIRQFLTPQEAELSSVLSTDTLGVHWNEALNLSKPGSLPPLAGQPDLFAGQDGVLVVTWAQGEDGDREIYFASGEWNADTMESAWNSPLKSSINPDVDSHQPQIVLDRAGVAHLVWVETNPESSANQIVYSRCQEGICSTPRLLSSLDGLACAPIDAAQADNDSPIMAIDEQDNLMVVWRNSAGILPYMLWPVRQEPPAIPNGCVFDASSYGTVELSPPGLSVGLGGHFVLVFAAHEEIYLSHFEDGAWSSDPTMIGEGNQPQVYIDRNSRLQAVWCNQNQLIVWDGEKTDMVTDIACSSRPELVLDGDGRLHVIWHGNQVKNFGGQIKPQDILYESIRSDDGWSPAIIVANTGGFSQPALFATEDGSLLLAWTGNANKQNYLYTATQIMYACSGEDLSGISQVVYHVAQQAGFRKSEDLIPYCQNHYDRLVFTPNSAPEFSEQPPTVNGAFDHISELIENAQYEALYATMWYDKDRKLDSPGSVIAQSVARLYFKVKEDPDSYPRGMTVRLLLGNPPELDGQLWYLLEDLRNAGVEEMINADIGWRLEVADFAGKYPHSHVKTLIIDGKTVIAAGFNTTYNHFDIDHFSGQGKGRFDIGLQVTGPIAQESLRVFDDIWVGANRRHCSNFHPVIDDLWQATCYDLRANGGHPPEVLRYNLPGGDTTAFSMYRSKVRDESDQQIVAALSSAQQSIDVIQVNFTMQLICDLNLLFQVCTAKQSMPYLDSLIKAVENNQARLRILIKPLPFEGIESLIAVQVMGQEALNQDYADLIEVRLFQGDMHPKASLIDNQFLIIGSQNFHYSAFGGGTGLNEYSLGVSDPKAIEDFQRVFNYYWEISPQLE